MNACPVGSTDVDFSNLSVIAVTYNSEAIIAKFLDQLEPAIAGGAEVIVVDNESSDGTTAVLNSYSPRVIVRSMGWNSGFARAVNSGVSASSHRFIAVLNPDLSIQPTGLLRLMDVLAADDEVGLVGPLIRQADGISGNSGAGRFPTVWRTVTTLWGLSLLAGPGVLEGTVLLQRQVGQRRDVDWLTGACLVTRRSHWDTVGGLSEEWFMYGEDVDLGWKVRGSGLRVTVEPSVTAEHAVGGSSGEARVRDKDSNPLEAAWIVNQYDFYKRRMSRGPVDEFAWWLVAWLGLQGRSVAHRLLGSILRRPALRYRGEWLTRCANLLWQSRSAQETT